MANRIAGWWSTLLPLVLLSGLTGAVAVGFAAPPGLPKIGTAAPFSLTAQDGSRVSLDDLRGKVALVTFIYTSCTDTCPLVTAKLALVQEQLSSDFGARVRFVSVTVDPEHDTPDVLDAYASKYGADLNGWAFLTGGREEIVETANAYGVFARRTPRGDVDHSFLTSLVDRRGVLRVQYAGYRFDPDELLADLRALVREW